MQRRTRILNCAPKGRPGFTLIELLVVIAIIAILAAILFPVFAQAREKARLTMCLNSQKQIATGLMMYAQDNDETFPSWNFGPGGVIDDPRFASGWTWSLWVDSVMPYVKNKGVFACPDGPQTTAFRRGPGPVADKILVHLAFNEYIMTAGRNFSTLAALSNAKNGIADISLVAESVTPGIYQDWSDNFQIADKPQPFSLYRLYCANGVQNNGAVCTSRHMDHGVNIIFADGHAKFVPGGRIQGGNQNPRGEYPIINPNATSYAP